MSSSGSSASSSSSFPRLVADVGGTNVRFASQDLPQGPLLGMTSYGCADDPGLRDLMRHHLQSQGLERPHCCAIGIATAITGDQVQMTNHPGPSRSGRCAGRRAPTGHQ